MPDSQNQNPEGATRATRLFYALPPAFAVGIQDSVNPFALSALLVFYLFLLAWQERNPRFIFKAVVFLLAFTSNNIRIVLGIYDKYLMLPVVENTFLVIHLLLATFFVVVGVDYYKDWAVLRKDGVRVGILKKIFGAKKTNPQPQPQHGGVTNRIIKVVFSYVLVWIYGIAVSFLVSVWPVDYLFFLNFYYGLQSGSPWAVFGTFIYYAIGYSIFFILLLFASVSVSRLKARGENQRTPLQSIVLAAIFISVGLGLIQITIQALLI